MKDDNSPFYYSTIDSFYESLKGSEM